MGGSTLNGGMKTSLNGWRRATMWFTGGLGGGGRRLFAADSLDGEIWSETK